MAAAVELRSRGIARVVVLDREKQAGGVPRHCGHPPFGMREFKRVLTGPSYARRLTSMAEQAGVEIFSQHTVVSLEPRGSVNVSNDELCSMIKAKRVIIATGARETPRSARLISGDRPLGISIPEPCKPTSTCTGFCHSDPAKLRVKAGRHDLWTQRLSTSPERRVLIPLRGVEIPTGVSKLTVALDAEAIR